MPGRTLPVLTGVWLMTLAARAVSPNAPDVAEILRQTAERARAVAAAGDAAVAEYRKVSWYETLDSDGVVVRRSEKIYEVRLIGGMTENRLIAVNGRILSPEESDERSRREREWRDRYAAGPGNADRMDDLVNEDLFARFHFTLVGSELVGGRLNHVLRFTPKPGKLPDNRIIDRLINLLTGTIWIDAEEYEITRAEVQTLDRLRLWGGVLGSIHDFSMRLDRQRSPEGIWFNQHTHMDLRARRLFSRMHVRVREIAEDIRPALAAVE